MKSSLQKSELEFSISSRNDAQKLLQDTSDMFDLDDLFGSGSNNRKSCKYSDNNKQIDEISSDYIASFVISNAGHVLNDNNNIDIANEISLLSPILNESCPEILRNIFIRTGMPTLMYRCLLK